MALILPLHVLDGLRRSLCGSRKATTSGDSPDLVHCLIERVSLLDALRWRRVSKAFRSAVDARMARITRLELQSVSDLRNVWQRRTLSSASNVTWHHGAPVAFVETSSQHLCIYVDASLVGSETRILVDAVSCFRHFAETVFMDSPILELLVAEMSKQQVELLVLVLRQMRSLDFTASKNRAVIPISSCSYNAASFFPRLRQLTIQSLAQQLPHLSRLQTYAVGVDRIYEPRSIDLLCLKITVASSTRESSLMFRHVTRFRQWTDADSLGLRYFQQFGGQPKMRRRHSTTISPRP